MPGKGILQHAKQYLVKSYFIELNFILVKGKDDEIRRLLGGWFHAIKKLVSSLLAGDFTCRNKETAWIAY
jgi:hypothetical protein